VRAGFQQPEQSDLPAVFIHSGSEELYREHRPVLDALTEALGRRQTRHEIRTP
jgi:hypothetical protein